MTALILSKQIGNKYKRVGLTYGELGYLPDLLDVNDVKMPMMNVKVRSDYRTMPIMFEQLVKEEVIIG